MPASDSLKRLGGGRWETRDGRFAIEPQSGTWVIVDNEQTDELGLPLVRGPFGSLTAAKDAIETARSEGPRASPLAELLEQARSSAPAKARKPELPLAGEPAEAATAATRANPESPPTEPTEPTEPAKPQLALEPRWLRDLEPEGGRRARDLIARLERMGVADAERIARAEVAEGQPALARLAIERAIARAADGPKDPVSAVRAAVAAVLRGADVELGVSWKLVDGEGRSIDKVQVPRTGGGRG